MSKFKLKDDHVLVRCMGVFTRYSDVIFALTYILLLLAVIFYFYGSFVYPSDPLVFKVQHYFQLLGFCTAFFLPLTLSVIRLIFTGGSGSVVYNIMGRAIFGLAVYSIVLWLIGNYGDAVKAWGFSNPEDAVVSIVSLILALSMLVIAKPSFIFGSSSSLQPAPYRTAIFRGKEL